MIFIKKQKLFLDFDSTIVDTVKAFCKTYNEIYSWLPGFKEADHTKVSDWNFADECPLQVGCTGKMFEMKELFDNLEFFPDAAKTIRSLHDKYEIIIVTIGSPQNIAHKALWISENLPFLHEMIFISNRNIDMDKSIIDMSGGIFIDDHGKNLSSSNADSINLFGEIKPWNKEWLEDEYNLSDQNRHFKDWNHISKVLLSKYKDGDFCGLCHSHDNVTKYTIEDRRYGSKFDSAHFNLYICDECMTDRYLVSIWEKPTHKGMMENYKYEYALEELIRKCKEKKGMGNRYKSNLSTNIHPQIVANYSDHNDKDYNDTIAKEIVKNLKLIRKDSLDKYRWF